LLVVVSSSELAGVTGAPVNEYRSFDDFRRLSVGLASILMETGSPGVTAINTGPVLLTKMYISNAKCVLT
jgi:exosome complex RNA-binding protein Rrp42 (RNase PH superfamily)